MNFGVSHSHFLLQSCKAGREWYQRRTSSLTFTINFLPATLLPIMSYAEYWPLRLLLHNFASHALRFGWTLESMKDET